MNLTLCMHDMESVLHGWCRLSPFTVRASCGSASSSESPWRFRPRLEGQVLHGVVKLSTKGFCRSDGEKRRRTEKRGCASGWRRGGTEAESTGRGWSRRGRAEREAGSGRSCSGSRRRACRLATERETALRRSTPALRSRSEREAARRGRLGGGRCV